jgi:hypothetical protein
MTTATAPLSFDLPDEERDEVEREQQYRQLLARLSHQSVVKHFDAYADVPWDDPAYAIDPADPRFELSPHDPLARTAWYQSQPQAVRARIGLHMMANFMRIGRAFESILKRGILEFVDRLPDDAPEIRYAYHEVIEEAQHSLMFHEFVRRAGLPVPLPRVLTLNERRVLGFARRFPEVFFMLVLSGEDPIDWSQRKTLQDGREHHPLLERIIKIHITEEARHMSFARHYLRRTVPALGPVKRLLLRLRTPFIFAVAASLMMKPSRAIVQAYGIPRSVLREAYGPGSVFRAFAIEALRKPRDLCRELGVLDEKWERLWSALGILG